MLRSMISAASAVRNHQTYMDVVANNIANVNTTGFKSGRASFRDLLSQVMAPGSAPTANRGGINPIQVGLGMSLGAVNSVLTQGAPQNTGRANDLAIQGEGFFIFNGPTQYLYSRDGTLDLALDGSLANSTTGLQIMGWNARADGTLDTTGPLQAIHIPLNGGAIAQATQNAILRGNLNANDTIVTTNSAAVSDMQLVTNTVSGFGVAAITAGQNRLATGDYYIEVNASNQYRLVDGSGNPVAFSGNPGAAWTAIPAGGGTVDTGRGLTVRFGAGPYTAGTKGAGAARVHFDNGGVNTTAQIYDSLGAQHAINIAFFKNAVGEWRWEATSNDPNIRLGVTTSGVIDFSNTGQLPANAAARLSLTFLNGAAAQSLNLDLSNMTQLAQQSDINAAEQDGLGAGNLTSFSVSANGEVVGSYSNGMYRTVGQLALANFANPGGLLRTGDNMFSASGNSGAANAGPAATGGRGSVQSGYLEMSNVDIAQQFTSMIMAERGFQANSRVITASDQMLQDLVNLVR